MKKNIIIFSLFYFLFGYSQFTDPIIVDNTIPLSIRQILVFDIDGDGKKDIVTSYFQNDIKWYKNLGSNFDLPISLTSLIPNPYHMDYGDANGDGKLDLLITNNFGNSTSIIILFNNGNNNWTYLNLETNIFLGAFKSFFSDFDNDGDIDVISNCDTKILLFKNNGFGVYTLPIVVANSSEYYSLTVNDFNNDNFKDFIVHAGAETLLYINNTLGGFNSPIIVGSNGVKIFLTSTDLDNDNDNDMICQNPNNSNQLQFYKNNGTGFFMFDHNEFGYFSSDQLLTKFNLNNLNNFDILKDVVYIEQGTNSLKYRLNNNVGVFESTNLINSNYDFQCVFSEDIDNDLDNDIVFFGNDFNSTSNLAVLGIIFNENMLSNQDNLDLDFQEVVLYPNPADNELIIKSNSLIDEIQIYNSIGQIIFKSNDTIIDISKFQNGIYFTKILFKNSNSIKMNFLKK